MQLKIIRVTFRRILVDTILPHQQRIPQLLKQISNCSLWNNQATFLKVVYTMLCSMCKDRVKAVKINKRNRWNPLKVILMIQKLLKLNRRDFSPSRQMINWSMKWRLFPEKIANVKVKFAKILVHICRVYPIIWIKNLCTIMIYQQAPSSLLAVGKSRMIWRIMNILSWVLKESKAQHLWRKNDSHRTIV